MIDELSSLADLSCFFFSLPLAYLMGSFRSFSRVCIFPSAWFVVDFVD
jgi:hypothetical protein